MLKRIVVASLIAVAGSTPSRGEQGPTKCAAENAVYEALHSNQDDFPPDTLRFDYEAKEGGIGPWRGWPKKAVIHSAQRERDYVFDTYFTNNSGKEGISLSLPAEELDEYLRVSGKPLRMDSDVFSVWPDLEIGFLPLKGMEAPQRIMLPGFRSFAHASYTLTISSGIGRSIFRFARCEGDAEFTPEMQPDTSPQAQQTTVPDGRASTDEEIIAILGAKAWPPKPNPKKSPAQ